MAVNEDIDKIVNVFSSVVDCNNKIIYLAHPIYSGKQFIKWYLTEGVELEYFKKLYLYKLNEKVAEPNRQIAENFVSILNLQYPKAIIINPSRIKPMNNFSEPEDYLIMWERIIEKFVNKIVFIEGWEYSRGCIDEYITATNLNLEVLDDKFNPIFLTDGIKLIETAIEYMDNKGFSTISYIEQLEILK